MDEAKILGMLKLNPIAIKNIDKYVRFIATAASFVITANIFIIKSPELCIMEDVKS